MPTLPCSLSLSLFLIASLAPAQQEGKTDAQSDDLLGPVKTVSTVVSMSQVKWQQPSGPSLVLPVECRDCAYDPDGTKTVSGQIVNGNFIGELIDIRRDGEGHVTERTFTSSSTGQVYCRQVIGPYGKTAETDYDSTTGKLQAQQTFAYDQYGNMHDWLTLDGNGKQAGHEVINRLKDGTLTEESAWGKNGELSWQQTYDPETDVGHFTTFDESGAMKLTWTFAHGKVISFWEQPGLSRDGPQFGESFSDFGDRVNVDNFSCHENGQCDHYRIHYEYLDPAKKRNPTIAEWRDAEGNLLYAAYCHYDLDPAGNWTHRKISVYSPELGDRTPYEQDSRTITYWDK
ncbi:MAG TPA: hypothetical protein VMQ56_01785 [Terracidiphilus sp.]|jgi:hypothetical protein|nr:hypothetical protein [Terracidiphilus sp.]